MTIYDIAREAGVSASTVSRVINHKPGIKESTRQRVQELLERYHYTPDISARGLVTQASRFIGILIEDIRVEHHTESAYVLEQAMTAKGYTCITFSTGPQPERKAQYIQILEQRRVEGVFLIGSMFGTPEVRQSVAQHMHGIPVVLVNGELDLPNAYNVLADEQQGTADCVALLAEAGRRRPAYLMDTDTPANRNKVCGFRQGLARCGLHPNARIPAVPSPGDAGKPLPCWHSSRTRTASSAPPTCWPSAACRSCRPAALPYRSRWPWQAWTTPCMGSCAPLP